ncbi:uncharacterized protein NDAI_0F00150 [Naumovozyma dairenensis CBS 421]|uniref:Hyphally-regulated cell wall protein N-terminal domain-containing protein n=1 Tax=Naumovozyma dairenensis (strain ATCC 10597 / BCRC 20456 / CBS 421 / NBRC 0211 / NRRL Y-12639) TaxID=1071378 RepID=G0WC23_NAUDC|nr:hypothetical protein NDAI_0F00150 [Naumovozyma dairenensis CBS 421]CCD25334.1 hypothetical protein NDAI_0F00150 [Naumovozyma dairenensis CBS 421]
MISFYTYCALVLPLIPNLALGLDISRNVTLAGSSSYQDGVSVAKGSTFSLVDGSSADISGDLSIEGTICLGSYQDTSSNMDVSVSAGSVSNSGSIVINPKGSAKLDFGSFQNLGYIAITSGTQDTETFSAQQNFNNQGQMYFGTSGPLEIEGPSSGIENSGTLAFVGNTITFKTGITGDGCMSLQQSTTLNVDMDSSLEPTIWFGDDNSNTLILNGKQQNTPTIKGFGGSNTIVLNITTASNSTSTPALSYDGNTGILTVSGASTVKLDIGTGYDSSSFTVSGSSGINGVPDGTAVVGYNSNAPDSNQPSSCQTVSETPMSSCVVDFTIPDPITTSVVSGDATVSEVISYYSTTESDGFAATATTISIIEVSSSSSIASSSSILKSSSSSVASSSSSIIIEPSSSSIEKSSSSVSKSSSIILSSSFSSSSKSSSVAAQLSSNTIPSSSSSVVEQTSSSAVPQASNSAVPQASSADVPQASSSVVQQASSSDIQPAVSSIAESSGIFEASSSDVVSEQSSSNGEAVQIESSSTSSTPASTPLTSLNNELAESSSVNESPVGIPQSSSKEQYVSSEDETPVPVSSEAQPVSTSTVEAQSSQELPNIENVSSVIESINQTLENQAATMAELDAYEGNLALSDPCVSFTTEYIRGTTYTTEYSLITGSYTETVTLSTSLKTYIIKASSTA